jgi:hypothetical protein
MLAVSTTRVIVAAANTPRTGTRKVAAKKPAGKVRVFTETARARDSMPSVGVANRERIGSSPTSIGLGP